MNYREVSEASRAAYFKAKTELDRHLPVLPFFAGWNAAKYHADDSDSNSDTKDKTITDLYTWLDSIVHESLPENYEELNPRELREHLASALYGRLTDDKDFQNMYVDSIFPPREIIVDAGTPVIFGETK